MAEYQCTREEVQQFLNRVKALIPQKDKVTINISPWKGHKVNKTLTYMTETGIGLEDILNVLYKLQGCHYSYTADDRNIHFKGQQVWIFGLRKNIVDKDEDLYIKLKILTTEEDILLIMSFHPENPGCDEQRLQFPYKNTKEI